MKKIIFFLIFNFTGLLFSQNNDLEQRSLDLFLAGDWKGLTALSNAIEQSGFKTYEPEYRLAVAYYNQKNYFDSARIFEHIISQYGIKNDAVLEYLYYSYLFSGRPEDALLTAKDFPFHMQAITGVKGFRFINRINAEGGVKLSDSKVKGVENLTYFSTGIGQQLGYRLSLQHAYTNITQDYIDFNYNQNEYYGALKWQLAKGLTLIPAYHFAQTIETDNSTTSNFNGMDRNNPSNNSDSENELITHIVHIALKKQWHRFSVSPNFVYINTNNASVGVYRFFQYGLHAGWSVKPTNDKLWLGAGFDMIDKENDNAIVWNAKLYYALGTKAYLHLRYLSAGNSGFVQENAQYYYNAVSELQNNFNTSFGYRFTPKLEWYVNYQFENAKDNNYNFTFSYNTIIIGLIIDL